MMRKSSAGMERITSMCVLRGSFIFEHCDPLKSAVGFRLWITMIIVWASPFNPYSRINTFYL
jgi:hypothetical protein